MLLDYNPETGEVWCDFNPNYVCVIEIFPRGKSGEISDVIIATPDKPIVTKGNVELINSENETNKYKIITNN
jgi:hypothetical protein